MSRLSADEVEGIIAAIKAGKLTAIIAVETGRSPETIRYVAAKHKLTLKSRYTRLRPGNYWASYFKRRVMVRAEADPWTVIGRDCG